MGDGGLDTRAVLERWLLELAQDISQRLSNSHASSP
jgi:hypothetical protein